MANCCCLLSLRAKSWREEKRAEVPTRALFFLLRKSPLVKRASGLAWPAREVEGPSDP